MESRKAEIFLKNSDDRKKLISIEDSILSILTSSNDLLKDETLINELHNSKRFAAEISKRVNDSKTTEEDIDDAREYYRSIAKRASLLYFCI